MIEDKTIQLTVSPTEFFREKVSSAIDRQKLEVNDDIEFYLVNLLCEYINPTRDGSFSNGDKLLDTPLALQLKNALEAPPEKQFRIFKQLGDTSLYISGYFQDFFNRKIYDIDYFITLGSSAYDNIAILMRDRDDSFADTYHSLAKLFKRLVEVVAEVSDGFNPNQSLNVLATYDRWTKNQDSERLRRKLEESGILPIPISTKLAQ
ncbi:MAG: hypothetical protein R3B45_08875 [Bdellovibrionota bacterium]